MSKGLLNSFKNGTIPETVKNTEENIKEEVVATPVEPAKEESELETHGVCDLYRVLFRHCVCCGSRGRVFYGKQRCRPCPTQIYEDGIV